MNHHSHDKKGEKYLNSHQIFLKLLLELLNYKKFQLDTQF